MSIRLRFTLALTAVGVVLFGTYAWWAYASERNELRAAASSEIRILGQSLETAVGNALRDKQSRDIEETLSTLEALAPKVDIYVHDADGKPIARSRGAVRDAVIESLAGHPATARSDQVMFAPPEDPTRLIFTGALTVDDGTVIGTLVVARPTDDMTSDLQRTRDRLLLALGVFLIGALVAGLALGTIYVARPIARLLDGVRQVREGDFRARVRPGRGDEIGELVAEFNAMIATLAESRARIEAEAEARTRLELGLQRVDKLVTIGQLSAGLAHEIGSPLQVLSGRASAIVDHADPEVRRQAQLIVAQCDRITRVVEQLLSFGRRTPAVIGPCDLVVPVVAVIDLLATEARRRQISLELDTADGPHQIVGDVDQLQQVTLNLVRNAMNATPPGGSIFVRVDRAHGLVRLMVRDTGPGMDQATKARLGEPFFTTRASEGGTGLGLAVVRAIAEEHRAKVEVISEPGAGAEFVVSFPHHKELVRA
ncbi:MAG TPA: HAMP domain-containing sensor histidine kinase [Kofleriaceae bacterium]|nr:HAMP domain-containing sensor histidine kinase [Kofleriaceae bacterium]